MMKELRIRFLPQNQHNPESILVLFADAEENLAVCTAPEGMVALKGWDGKGWQLRGYSVELPWRGQRDRWEVQKGSFTLGELEFSEGVIQELEVFFVLFCEIEHWKSLAFQIP